APARELGARQGCALQPLCHRPLSAGRARLAAKLSAVDDPREFLIDPGADAETILNATAGFDISAIVLTYTHFDHVTAAELVTELRYCQGLDRGRRHVPPFGG